MPGLTHIEKQKLEIELRMKGGFVLDFTDRTFAEFFHEVVKVEIYDSAYALGTGSKANRMRAFWLKASDNQLRLLFEGLLDGWSVYSPTHPIPDSAHQLLTQLLKKFGGVAVDSSQTKPEGVNALDQAVSQRLATRLIEVTKLPPQKRGFEFEKFLNELFNGYGLSARASFRLIGEQIDGSFVMHHETYLLEAKWQDPKVGAADLHTFNGKLLEKADWSRGLFISISGFSSDGLEAYGRAKKIVCMDGLDLHEMLRLRRSFVEILDAKVRRAAETGSPFVPIRDL